MLHSVCVFELAASYKFFIHVSQLTLTLSSGNGIYRSGVCLVVNLQSLVLPS
jgi:hypothetical protein